MVALHSMPKPLLLNGKPFSTAPATPAIDRVKRFLDKQPDNEVFDTNDIIRRNLANRDTVFRAARWGKLDPYCHLTTTGRTSYLFGNPRAIAKVKKMVGGK